jgi:hypothetical protein
VSKFGDLRTIGMAASLAVHLRGLPEISYGVLSQVSDACFDIPAPMLKPVLRLLKEVGMVQLYESGKTITKIDPTVPYFEDVYEKIGELSEEYTYNEVETATVRMLSELFNRPENKEQLLHRTSMDAKLLSRCLQIAREGTGGLVTEHRARERTILVSPLYFADNTAALADLIAKTRSDDFRIVVGALTQHQGWPLSMIIAKQAIAGSPLTPLQVELARMLAAENVLKPPTIEIGGHAEPFIFTPRPGNARLSPGKTRYLRESHKAAGSSPQGPATTLPLPDTQAGSAPWLLAR